MGFNAAPKRYKFVFDDPDDEYFGLEFRARGLSVGEYNGVMREMAELSSLRGVASPTADQLDKALGLYRLFAPYLVDWNLETTDETGTATPIPPTKEGLEEVEPELAMFMVNVWIKRVVGVAAPLGKPSSSGAIPGVESLPMESLSASLTS